MVLAQQELRKLKFQRHDFRLSPIGQKIPRRMRISYIGLPARGGKSGTISYNRVCAGFSDTQNRVANEFQWPIFTR